MHSRSDMPPPTATATAAAPVRPRFAVIQDGSRLHYAIPVALQAAGLLERVYTDWYGPPGSLQHAAARVLAAVAGGAGRRVLDRWSPDLDPATVRSSPVMALRHHRARRRFRSDPEFYDWAAERTARWVLGRGFGGATAVFGFVRNVHPMLLAEARRRGMLTIADQMIAPAAVEAAEARVQHERFPGWEAPPDAADVDRLVDTERRTWALTDHLTCASDYVRDGLVGQGVPAAKVTVIPYPIDASHYPVPARDDGGGRRPITVGFVGAVCLRKGAPYFLEVARRLSGDGVRFVLVGPVRVTPHAAGLLREHVEVVGQVPRSEVTARLAGFDAFFFPSTCEGSAGAVMEAMACGLPVVTTPNSGTVVRDGVDGYVRGYDDVDGLAAAVAALRDDPARRRAMGESARARVAALGIAAYRDALAALATRLAAATT